MLEKKKIYEKYLDKNNSKSMYRTANSFQLYNKTKYQQANEKNKIVIHDELDPLDENIYESILFFIKDYGDELNPTVINPNTNEIVNIKDEERKKETSKQFNPTKWIAMNEDDFEDHEDEIRALKKAKNEYDNDNSDSEEENLNKKRKRHDTDDEKSDVEEDKYNTEDELNELLPQQDEDGDIILEPKLSKGNKIKNGLISLSEYRTNKNLNKNIFEEISKKPTINNTIYRDKEGRIIKPGETKEEKQKKLKELNEKQLQKWMKGVKQAEELKKKEETERLMKNEPLARYEIDHSVEDEMKKKDRFGDPMKQLMEFKNLKDKQGEDISNNVTQQDDLIRNLNPENSHRKKLKRKCKFKAPPNRYGIDPGYMWDGVDRGNGFEQRLLASRNIRNAQKNEYYKLRTEEM